MKKITLILLLFIFLFGREFAFKESNDFLIAPSGAYWFGLYGFDNPALLYYMNTPDIFLLVSTEENDYKNIKDYGVFYGSRNFGFGYFNSQKKYSEYRISSAFGNKKFSIGTGFGWNNEKNRLLTIGTLIRPNPFISSGFYLLYPFTQDAKIGYLDIGIRPFKNELLTLFGDFSLRSDDEFEDVKWNLGGIVEPLKGIRFSASYSGERRINLGISLSLGNIGFVYKTKLDNNFYYLNNIYGVRFGMNDRTIFPKPTRKDYLKLNLYGELKYQRYKYFDKSNTLLDILKSIDDAKKDKDIKGIVINTSGMLIDIEKIWEIREKLKDFKRANKKVIVYLDDAGLFEYYLASVADKVVLDPQGTIVITGLVSGRTYIKNALDKIGIGVDELRFFKYKSAAESYSRENMSDADREQRQRIIDVIYEIIRKDICEERKMKEEEFDRIVNEEILLLANDALENNLVDTLLRWDRIDEILKDVEKSKIQIKKVKIPDVKPEDSYWGEKPKIAIIYALGVCAMDEGITSRKLIYDVEWAIKNPDVKGIILRVDSPGGDVLASDIIAEAIKKAKGKKPIIISHGLVAASGGYWLSMYGDVIVSSPFTITGSVGVIGMFLYNKGLKEKLGLSTDYVKRGEHSDMYFPFVIPFINFALLDRPLDTYERGVMEKMIKEYYKEFVTKVSNGRNKRFEEIQEIAEGRVWTGYDAKNNGLVDVIGSLEDAIKIAKEKAKIIGDFEIIELPNPKSFSTDIFTPKLINTEDYIIKELKFRAKYNGKPLLMLPIEDIELIRMMENKR